jgi:hypothetical protein
MEENKIGAWIFINLNYDRMLFLISFKIKINFLIKFVYFIKNIFYK